MGGITVFLRNALIKAYPLFHGCAACPDRLPGLRERTGSLPSPEFPVDLVYTWVNGADEALAVKRASCFPPREERSDQRHGLSLYRDNDELRFSLRSAHAYAPWVRKIFLVTDAQVPEWLDSSHPRITVVDHRDYIPRRYLPTFNSRVIETFLHEIPGLTEHYIYCNDDFFLSSPCLPGDFFTSNGLPYLFMDWRKRRKAGYAASHTPHASSYANVRSYLASHGVAEPPDCIIAHGPYPQTKRNARDAFAFYREAVEVFCHNKFRSHNEMTFSSHAIPLWAFAKKRAVPCDVPYYYINAKRFDRKTYYATMLRQKDTGTLPPFFCLNDVGDAPPGHTWRSDIREFLAAFYPVPSPFELRPSS